MLLKSSFIAVVDYLGIDYSPTLSSTPQVANTLRNLHNPIRESSNPIDLESSTWNNGDAASSRCDNAGLTDVGSGVSCPVTLLWRRRWEMLCDAFQWSAPERWPSTHHTAVAATIDSCRGANSGSAEQSPFQPDSSPAILIHLRVHAHTYTLRRVHHVAPPFPCATIFFKTSKHLKTHYTVFYHQKHPQTTFTWGTCSD